MGEYRGRVFIDLVRQVIGFAGPDEASPFERRQEPDLRRFDSARRDRLVPGRPERRL
jgi:hypothetical protein